MKRRDDGAESPTDSAGSAVSDFGEAGVPWWAESRVRLGLLLVCLLATILAFVAVGGVPHDLGGAHAQVGEGASGAECPGRSAPEVDYIPLRDVGTLRRAVSRIVPSRLWREYEEGIVTTGNLWLDNRPLPASESLSRAGLVSAGYELRWWVPGRTGGENDIAVDVLEFATNAKAEDVLAKAESPRCRASGEARAVSTPPGGSSLFWVNPDRVEEWDALFVRGRRLYRIVDVPPGHVLAATEHATRGLDDPSALVTVDSLACAVQGADCPNARSRALHQPRDAVHKPRGRHP